MKRIALLLSLLTTLAFSQSIEAFAKKMHYETDYKTAFAKAQKSKKDVLFVMVTNYCPWCRKLEKLTLSHKSISSVIEKKYVALILNREKKEFPQKLYKPIVPVIYVLDYKTQEPKKTIAGYKSRYDLIDLI